MISLAGLNERQREAASTISGPLLILAGAGSGKTRTITYRMAHMIDNLGIPSKSVLGITFTNKAAKEMKERVNTLLSAKKSRGITLCTFHSLCVRILKKQIHHLGMHHNFSIYDSSDQAAIIREALTHFKAEKATFELKVIISKISSLKNLGITSDDFADSEYFDGESPYDHAIEYCYRVYTEKLKFFNSIDFDDIILSTVQILEEHPEVAKEYSELYQYIMVDEYQDTNPLQFRLIKCLTSTHNNICVVGDDDQSIYSFRGADITNILSFEKIFKGAKVIKLEENYRSTNAILALANKVIIQNKERKEKSLFSSKHSDKLPLLWQMGDTDHEAQVIVEDILNHQRGGKNLADIAILYRSNTQVPPFEAELTLSAIPYKVLGGQKLYDKKEVKDIIAYLNVILNPNDELSLRRILNVPSRGIGLKTLEKYLALGAENKNSLFENLKNFPDVAPNRKEKILEFTNVIDEVTKSFKHRHVHEGIEELMAKINYHQYIEKQYAETPKQIERRRQDLHFFTQFAENFLAYQGDNATLKTFMEKITLQELEFEKEEEDDEVRENQVTLMTLHSSKGLEYDIVYLIGAEEETLPHKRTIIEGTSINEECRLFYVGITRAREKLVMTYTKQRKIYGKETPRFRTRFLEEIKDSGLFLEQDRTTFNHMSEDEEKKYKKDFFSNLMGLLDEEDKT